MTRKFLIPLMILIWQTSQCQDFLPGGIAQRVFKISTDTLNNAASSFLYVDRDEEVFLITAKHVFDQVKMPNESKIRLYVKKENKWDYFDGTLFHHTDPRVDVSILRIFEEREHSLSNQFDLGYGDLIYGAEGYILGFPYALTNNFKDSIFPLALIKRVIQSGLIQQEDVSVVILDGHNNPGFSGGPVLFKNYSKPKNSKWTVVGVISGYIPQTNEQNTPLGKLKYSENSGIMTAFSSKHIIELIKQSKGK